LLVVAGRRRVQKVHVRRDLLAQRARDLLMPPTCDSRKIGREG
jgi:hypothetical protein